MGESKRPTRLPARFRKTPWAVAIATALLPAGSAGVNSPGAAVASEFVVNQVTAGVQHDVAVAADADGDFVVVWSTPGEPITAFQQSNRIIARRYSASGAPLSDEFQVSLNAESYGASQVRPDVAMDADGDFVVTWNRHDYDYSNPTPNGIMYGIAARRYDAAGIPQGQEFEVSPRMTRLTGAPSATMDADGDFVIAWPGDGPDSRTPVFARRYGADGGPLDGGFPVSQTATGLQSAPDVAMDADGDFAVAWIGPSGSPESQVLVRRFGAAGTALGDELQVNVPADDDVSAPSVAMDADGDFVIAWRSADFYCSPYFYYGYACYSFDQVTARRYDASGQALGEQFIVASDVLEPAVARASSGDFVVTWRQSWSPHVYGQRYNNDGAPQGGGFQLPRCTQGNESGAVAALDADGDLVVAWEGLGPSCQPTSSSEIFARQFAGVENVDLRLSIVDDADPVPAGGSLSYTLSVVNQHPAPAASGDPARDAYLGAVGVATGLSITFLNPSGVAVPPDAGSGTDWTCTGRSCRYAGKLPPGATTSLTFSLTAPAYGGTVTASAILAGGQFDATPGDNAASESTWIDGPPPPLPNPAPRADNGGGLTLFDTLLALLAAAYRRLRLRRARTP